MNLDKILRIGIDKLVLSGVDIETNKPSLIIQGANWVEEKVEIKEELFSIVKSTKLYDNGEITESNYINLNPNRILYGHNIVNSRKEELIQAVDKLKYMLERKGINASFDKAKIAEIEINTNIKVKFEDYKEVLTLLFLRLPNLRKISNHNKSKAYRRIFMDSTLDGGWQNHSVKAYDKRREVNNESILNFDLLRVEWRLASSSYKYYVQKFSTDSTLQSLINNDSILDNIFRELCLKKLLEGAYKELEDNIYPQLEQTYINFKKASKEQIVRGKKPKRNVFKYLQDNCWIFDYSYLIEIVSNHDKKHKGREINRIKKNYFHLTNIDKLNYLVEFIYPQ